MNERDIFDAALSIPDLTARRAFVETACAGNEALRQRAEALLKAHVGAGPFLERPVFPACSDEGRVSEQSEVDGPGAFARTEPFETSNDRKALEENEDDEDLVEFLQPSDTPGSLGRLGHYEVLEVLGRGSFGTVVKAFDQKLHRMVAIKVMAAGLALTSPPRKRFLREARASAAIRHENVVHIYAVDERPVPYLVMEFVDGQTLQQKLDRVGPIEHAQVVRIGHQIAEGLVAAHSQGLIHRDIKPANILLENGVERVKLTDFGLARAADDASLTQSGVIAGTPMYMAPEQALGGPIDQRADLFSLGSVLYVMCTGRPPFRASNTLAVLKRVAEDMPCPIREIIPEVPEWLCTLIARLHAKDPDDRIASAQEVADCLRAQLAALNASQGVHPRPGGLPPSAAAKPKTPADRGSDFMTSPRSWSGRIRSKNTRGRAVRLHRWALATAAIVGLAVAEWTGISNFRGTVAHFLASEGTLIVDSKDPGATIIVNGDGGTFQGYGSGQFLLKPGLYRVLIRKGDRILESVPVIIEKKRLHVVQVSGERTALAPAPAGQDLGSWGRLVDVLGGSAVAREAGRLTITVPGDSPRDLNPTSGFNCDAPRVLQTVDADFTAQVTVHPFSRPGPRSSYKNGADSYHGAGLILWIDDHNFLRFVLAGQAQFDDGAPFTHLQQYRNDQITSEELRWTEEAPTHLQIRRHGNMLILRTSRDKLVWTEYKRLTLAGLAPSLQVGVLAINTDAKAFTATFEDWSLTSDSSIAPHGAVRTLTTPG